jgi:phosphatidylglycerophosphatase A
LTPAIAPRVRLSLPQWHAARVLATWFGIGRLPIAPGTWGSLAALPFAWAIRDFWGVPGLGLASLIVFIAVAKASRVQDPGAIVIDEIAGQWLVLLAAPLSPLAWSLAFLLFRLFDIWKPWPVRGIDRHVKGGLGIMLDDVAAAGYAVLALIAILAISGALGVRN